MYKYCIFSVSKHPHFYENRGLSGAFCGPFLAAHEKKFCHIIPVAQHVARSVRKNMKKIFGGLKNVRIFAPAFERRGRPAGGAARGAKARVT